MTDPDILCVIGQKELSRLETITVVKWGTKSENTEIYAIQKQRLMGYVMTEN